MEEELRDISSKHDKKDAELQVMEHFPSFFKYLLSTYDIMKALTAMF